MAKKYSISPLILFGAGTILFSLAWLMPSFPLLAFIGFAPFIAIAVNNRKEKSMWTSLELVLAGLSISFFTGSFFSVEILTYTLVQAIIFTLTFLGYTFVRKSLGQKVSILTLPIFWMAMEYILLKWYPFPVLFLADIFLLKPEWTRWTQDTGYLSSSLWILICNVLLYEAVLTEKKVNWLFLSLFIISGIGPIGYSYAMETNAVTRDDMMQLYTNGLSDYSSTYNDNGEFIPRTAAWISVLILLFTFVKRKTSRK